MTTLREGAATAVLAAAEMALIAAAGFALLRRRGNTVAEAGAYALVSTLMVLSFLFQLAFVAGVPAASVPVEILVVVAAAGVVRRELNFLRTQALLVRQFFRQQTLVAMLIGAAIVGIFFQAVAFPPESIQWGPLTRILCMERDPAVFPWSSATAGSAAEGPLYPLNSLVLPHLFLRTHTDIGIGLIGWFAYLAIGFGTYALCRRYAWPVTAATVTMVVMSMPRIVMQSTTAGFEAVPSAAALVGLLALYRTLEAPNGRDLCFLVWCILFVLSTTAVDLAQVAILTALAVIVLVRRHGAAIWWTQVRGNRLRTVSAAVPALVFSQLWLMLPNYWSTHRWFGRNEMAPLLFNRDGIQGALANLIRYLLDSAHFTLPVEQFFKWTTGFSILGSLEWVYRVTVGSRMGALGAAVPFSLSWQPDPRTVWFGPFGLLLVLPALGYALRRAPSQLKALAVALVGYFFLMALVLAWSPANVHYFSFFFVCGGFCIGFFLTPWRLTAARRWWLQIAAALLLVYGIACNSLVPAAAGPDARPWPTAAPGGRTPLPTHGHTEARPVLQRFRRPFGWAGGGTSPEVRFFGDNRVAVVSGRIDRDAELWVISSTPEAAYPFLLRFPSARRVTGGRLRSLLQRRRPIETPLYLLFADDRAPDLGASAEIIWRADPETAVRGGMLVRWSTPAGRPIDFIGGFVYNSLKIQGF
jgi:hypothetical protein